MGRRGAKVTANRWARLSVGYYRDSKLIEVGPVGELAFVRLLAIAREVVETVDVDGAVPVLLALRELRDVTELLALVSPGATFETLIGLLSDVGLIRVEEKTIVVSSYGDWQTTRSEIDVVRDETRQRVAAYRARQVAKNVPEVTSGEGMEMGVYDTQVWAFADLRTTGQVKKGSKKVGAHGLDPKQVVDAERIVDHFSEVRKTKVGANFRVTPVWWVDVRRLLTGAGDSVGMTADQICDLIDFALQHKFWHAHCLTPAGLVKHGPKLFASDEFVAWAIRSKRDPANRPRNTLIGDGGPAAFRGNLAADKPVDWAKESGAL